MKLALLILYFILLNLNAEPWILKDEKAIELNGINSRWSVISNSDIKINKDNMENKHWNKIPINIFCCAFDDCSPKTYFTEFINQLNPDAQIGILMTSVQQPFIVSLNDQDIEKIQLDNLGSTLYKFPAEKVKLGLNKIEIKEFEPRDKHYCCSDIKLGTLKALNLEYSWLFIKDGIIIIFSIILIIANLVYSNRLNHIIKINFILLSFVIINISLNILDQGPLRYKNHLQKYSNILDYLNIIFDSSIYLYLWIVGFNYRKIKMEIILLILLILFSSRYIGIHHLFDFIRYDFFRNKLSFVILKIPLFIALTRNIILNHWVSYLLFIYFALFTIDITLDLNLIAAEIAYFIFYLISIIEMIQLYKKKIMIHI